MILLTSWSEFRRLDLDTIRPAECLFEEPLLQTFDIHFKVETFVRKVRDEAHAWIRGHTFGKMLGRQFAGRFENKSAFQRILELAHIAGPFVALEFFKRFIGNAFDLLPH